MVWLIDHRRPLGPGRPGEGVAARGGRTQAVGGERVPHPLLLRAQVADVVGGRHGRQADPADDLEVVSAESAVLGGVVGDEAGPTYPQVGEDRRAGAVGPGVDGQAECGVGVDGVEALLLQRVGADLVAEPDPASLVAAQVDDGAAALLGDGGQGLFELRAAVAAQRADDVTGETFAVDADEDPCLLYTSDAADE